MTIFKNRHKKPATVGGFLAFTMRQRNIRFSHFSYKFMQNNDFIFYQLFL